MSSPSLTLTDEPNAVQLETQLDALDSSFDALSTSTAASIAAISQDLGEFEDRIELVETDVTSVQGDVTTAQSDVATLQSEMLVVQGQLPATLNTNLLIQAALDASTGVTKVNQVAFQASDVGDAISVTVDKTLLFLDCSNLAFLIGWNDSLSTLRPVVSFENCVLNSTLTDFMDLLDLDNGVGEVSLIVKNCLSSDGSPLPDMNFLILGGAT